MAFVSPFANRNFTSYRTKYGVSQTLERET